MGQSSLIKFGGMCALLWVVLEVIGNLMHPVLSPDPSVAMMRIHSTPLWNLTHLILIFNYIVLIPFGIGLKESFAESRWMRIGIPLLLASVAIGVVQVGMHPTILQHLSHQFSTAHDQATREYVLMLYTTFFSYNLVMEVGHMLMLYLVIGLAGLSMLSELRYPKFVAWLGIVGSVLASASTVIGVVVLGNSVFGSWLTFGVGLAPLAIWLVAAGILMLHSTRLTPTPLVAGAVAG